MDRRDALKLGAGLGATLAWGGLEACAPGAQGARMSNLPTDDLEKRLAGWDKHWDEIGEARFVEGFTANITGTPLSSEQRKELESSEVLFSNAIRTLFLTQSFRELPEEDQLNPEVQSRMQRNLGTINDTVFSINDMLADLKPEAKENIRATLRKHPGLAMKIAETIDEQAARTGVSRDMRLKFRSMMTNASFRLSRNDPSVVIDEYVDKVRRSTESGNDLGQNPIPGNRAMVSGAKMMGIGVVTFGLSYALASAGATPFIFTATVGAVLFAIGLITLIVGALIQAFSTDR